MHMGHWVLVVGGEVVVVPTLSERLLRKSISTLCAITLIAMYGPEDFQGYSIEQIQVVLLQVAQSKVKLDAILPIQWYIGIISVIVK